MLALPYALTCSEQCELERGLSIHALRGQRPAQQLVRFKSVPHHRFRPITFTVIAHREAGSLCHFAEPGTHLGDLLRTALVNFRNMLCLDRKSTRLNASH